MFRASLVLLLAVSATAAPPPNQRIVPNFRDLTVKTQITVGVDSPRETTWLLKGPRARVENRVYGMRFLGKSSDSENAPTLMSAGIFQCDLKTQYHLQPLWKTYIKQTAPERERPPDEISPLKGLMKRNPHGPDVTIAIDSVDTGERRQMGSYEARRITTTIQVEPGRGAVTKSGKVEIEGWYIDLQGPSCSERDSQEPPPQVGKILMEILHNGDHATMKQLGAAPRGFPVEEKSKRRDGGNVIVGKVELVEFSEKALDPSLFEPPSDYTERRPGQLPAHPFAGPEGSPAWIDLRH